MNRTLNIEEMEWRFQFTLNTIANLQRSFHDESPFLGARMDEALRDIIGQCDCLPSEASMRMAEAVCQILNCLAARIKEAHALKTILADETTVPVESHFLAVSHPALGQAPSILAEELIGLLPAEWQERLNDREFRLKIKQKQASHSLDALL